MQVALYLLELKKKTGNVFIYLFDCEFLSLQKHVSVNLISISYKKKIQQFVFAFVHQSFKICKVALLAKLSKLKIKSLIVLIY